MQSEIEKLIGLKVIIEISEPWEVSVALGNGTIIAVVEKVKNSLILLRLRTPIKIKDKLCDYLIASERYEGETIQDILQGKRLIVSITAVSKEDSEKTDPFMFSSWKTGMGLIGTILKGNS